MGKASEPNWVNNERNGACSPDWQFNIIYYMGTLAHEPHSSLSDKDLREVLKTHRHLSRCQICREGYIYFKEVLASNPDSNIKNTYAPTNFRLLKKNEKYLDILLTKRR